MRTYWIILILTLIPTQNVLMSINLNIKMIIVQINSICMINCADYHLSDHHANIIQLSKVILMHNTVFTSISIHTKLIFLFVIL